mgnify:CR=1 FL=1
MDYINTCQLNDLGKGLFLLKLDLLDSLKIIISFDIL